MYVKSSATGNYADGTQYVCVFKLVQCAAEDDAAAQAIVDAVWTMVGGIGFL